MDIGFVQTYTGDDREEKQLREVWPSLELYMHGGVSFTPYHEQFQKLIGKKVHYLEMYNASEGFFAAQGKTG
ncbi:MAG: GH3 auxin-responsive promoter family protein [Chitinophagaceae bacterium]